MRAIPRRVGSAFGPDQYYERSLSATFISHIYSKNVARIVTPEVAASLNPEKRYGISWHGKQRHVHTREGRLKDGKKTYLRIKKSAHIPRREWIGVPVPDPGIPKEWVQAAIKSIKDNEKVSNCGQRFWELTGACCAAPRSGMQWGQTSSRLEAWATTDAADDTAWACAHVHGARHSGQKRHILKNPARLERGPDEMMKQEKALASRSPVEDELARIESRALT